MIVKVVEETVTDRGETLWIGDVEKVTLLGVFVAQPGGSDVDLVKFDEATRTLNELVLIIDKDIKWTCGSGHVGVGYRFTFRSGASELGWFDAAGIYLMTDGGDTIDRLRSEVPVAARELWPGPVTAVSPLIITTSSGASTVTYNGTTWDVVN